VQDAHDLVCVGHAADPGVPCGVLEAGAEAGDGEDDNDGGEGRVEGGDEVGEDVGEGADEGDAALAELEVDYGAQEGGGGVAGERGEEGEGDNGVG